MGTRGKSRTNLRAVNNSQKIQSKPKGIQGPTVKTKSDSKLSMDPELALKIHDNMVKVRCLEERLITMYKQSDGYFWIGGPGEEAFNIPLGLQVKKGEGLDYDYLHLHYRSSGILVAMGVDPMGPIRQMKNTALDPYSGGRNFSNHFSIRDWNVVPVTSTIETQYATAIGTAIAQKRHGGDAITIVNGGDAGTAEGEFASCLVWASRPINPLPILMIVTNNGWGISTSSNGQHGEKRISDRGRAFGIESRTVNGNDVEESHQALKEAMEYVRKNRKPFLLEAFCSRLYGHSSASGANFAKNEVDPIVEFENKLENAGVISKEDMTKLRENYVNQFREMAKKVKEEPLPEGDTIHDYTFYGQKGRYW